MGIFCESINVQALQNLGPERYVELVAYIELIILRRVVRTVFATIGRDQKSVLLAVELIQKKAKFWVVPEVQNLVAAVYRHFGNGSETVRKRLGTSSEMVGSARSEMVE